MLDNSKLTYEEFSTLSTQIETCMNSRLLFPSSSDPTDIAALTSGHFLVGQVLTALPEPFDPQASFAVSSRYLLSVKMRNHFDNVPNA